MLLRGLSHLPIPHPSECITEFIEGSNRIIHANVHIYKQPVAFAIFGQIANSMLHRLVRLFYTNRISMQHNLTLIDRISPKYGTNNLSTSSAH
ncbi:hypothetical protein D3C78_936950 [compost metagenome]